jgi:DNA-binding response OmpR family regulator
VSDVEVDVDARLVRRGGTAVVLTPKAFELLLALVARRGRVVSRHELLREVWGYDASVTTRTVDAHVAELRRKLATLGAAELVATVWKVGYRLRE